MNDLLVFKNFSCGYGRSFNLKEISFSVKKGDFTGIVGPNGSGKTTLLKGITGELQANRGLVLLKETELSKISLKEKARQISVVSQFSDPADMTVKEYILTGRIPYRPGWQFFESAADISVAEKYMELTGIFHLKDKLLINLSGGELQLCAIARALTQEPELLLLDEATAHLDISHQVQILNLLQRLNRELDLTILMVIHDLNLAGEYCDNLIMMKQGSIYIQGSPHDVLKFDHIEKVYNTVVVTNNNPVSGKPAVFLVSEKVLKNNKTTNGQRLTTKG